MTFLCIRCIYSFVSAHGAHIFFEIPLPTLKIDWQNMAWDILFCSSVLHPTWHQSRWSCWPPWPPSSTWPPPPSPPSSQCSSPRPGWGSGQLGEKQWWGRAPYLERRTLQADRGGLHNVQCTCDICCCQNYDVHLSQEVFPVRTLVAWTGGCGEGESSGGGEEKICLKELHQSPWQGKDK